MYVILEHQSNPVASQGVRVYKKIHGILYLLHDSAASFPRAQLPALLPRPPAHYYMYYTSKGRTTAGSAVHTSCVRGNFIGATTHPTTAGGTMDIFFGGNVYERPYV